MDYFTYQKEGDHYNLGDYGKLISDIPYDDLSDKNTLDLYLPEIHDEVIPLVIFIHGGAFVKGDKARHLGGALQVLQRGYALASVNYRLNDEVRYPGFIRDVCEAIKYLMYHKNDYQLDDKHIVLWGDTHGGYIASKIAIEGFHEASFLSNTKFPQIEIAVQGVVSFYAPIDLYDYYKRQMDKNEFFKWNDKVVDEVTFGLEKERLLEFLKQLNFLEKIKETIPPFYLLHGCKDDNIPQEYTKKFYKALKQKKVPVILDMVEDGIHGIDFYDEEKYNEPIMRFIDNVMHDKVIYETK